MNRRSLSRHVLIPLAILSMLAVPSCDDESPIEPSPDCTLTLSPASVMVSADGGTGSIAVSIDGRCTWQAQSSASWLTLTTSAGTGAGAVAYRADSNPGETSRSATIAVGSQTVSFTQAGRPAPSCTYDVTPSAASFEKEGGTGTIAVTAPAGCPWVATSHEPWIAITSGAAGNGAGTVTYAVSETREPPSRTGTLTVAERTVTVSQEGDAGACTYSVAPVDLSTCLRATVLTTTITTEPACGWTAQTNVPWMSAPASGTGTQQISIAVGENYDAPRDGILMVRWPTPTAGQNVRVAQAGCRYAVSQTMFNAPPSQSTFSFMVLQTTDPNECGGPLQDACVWSSLTDDPWIVITTPVMRRGDEPVNFTVLANSGAARSGTIRVRDQVVHVLQAGTASGR